jgi:ligand-binding sensor domain-containing protein
MNKRRNRLHLHVSAMIAVGLVSLSVCGPPAEADAGKAAGVPPDVTVKAGRGKGHWRTFSVPEGLSSPAVYDILQDRAGNLWIGTLRGVNRYDGERFSVLTPKDGLAHPWVTAILEDRRGNLWFGTGGGVSRYDGKHFTTFTTKDGLAADAVRSILEDQAGNL